MSPNDKPRHNEVVRRIERQLLPLEEQGFVVLGEVACRVTDSSLPNTDVAVIRAIAGKLPDGITSCGSPRR